MTQETPIGIAGLGRMGTAIACRLIKLGHSVVVWNRNPARAEPLAKLGAEVVGSPAALAARCPVVISMLFDAAAVEAVYRGPQGLLSGDVGGRLFVDMSTIEPDAARAVGQAAARVGAEFVECPVGGSVGPAAEGKLLGLAAGNAAGMARARPVLELLCRKVVHAGPTGAGAALKLAVNLPLLVYWQALREALDLAAGTELSGPDIIEIMADTSGTPAAMKLRASHLAAAVASISDIPVGFELRGALKDLSAMTGSAERLGCALPVAAAARDAYAAAAAEGHGTEDAAWIAIRSRRDPPVGVI